MFLTLLFLKVRSTPTSAAACKAKGRPAAFYFAKADTALSQRRCAFRSASGLVVCCMYWGERCSSHPTGAV